MHTRPIRQLARRLRVPLRHAIAGCGVDARPGTLVLVTGGGEWAVKQIALALQSQLVTWYRRVEIIDLLGHRPYLSQANVHCLCRPAFFNGEGTAAVHRSNRLVVSWLHGGRRSGNPEIQAACRQLEQQWRKVHRFIVPNSVTRANVLECGVDPSRVHLIPNGVDTTQFHPLSDHEARRAHRRTLHIPDEAFVVGSFQRDEDDAGQPKLEKGPDILVDTVERVHRQHPIHVLLAGPSRSYVRRALEARGVPHTYQKASGTTDLLRLYHSIDAYLITSRDEGGPTTLRESLACGVPVVSTRMGLVVDLVQDGINGLVADVGDIDGLAAALLTLIGQPTLRLSLAGEGLRAIQALDFRVIARRYYEEVYRQVFK